MDSNRVHPLLSQVSLIVAPSLRPPQAVTLPYNYHKLPKTLPPEAGSIETLEKVITDTSGFLDALDTKHSERCEAYEKWKVDTEKQEIQEKRRIAPGYLDTSDRILEPVRQVKSPSNDSISSSEGDKGDKVSESVEDQLRKVFDNVAIQ